MGVDLKRGGGVISSKVFWCHKRYWKKLLTFDQMSPKYSTIVFQNWHKIQDYFFWFEFQNINTPHEMFYWMNTKFHVVYLYFEFKIKKIILILVKSPIAFLCCFSLWIINTEKNCLLLMCSVKKGVLERSVKLLAANKCNCS